MSEPKFSGTKPTGIYHRPGGNLVPVLLGASPWEDMKRGWMALEDWGGGITFMDISAMTDVLLIITPAVSLESGGPFLLVSLLPVPTDRVDRCHAVGPSAVS